MKRILLSFFFILCASISFAYDVEVDGIYYNLIEKARTAEVTYESTNHQTYSGTIDIPSSIKVSGIDYSVKTIGNEAFSRSYNVTSINIPSSITSIGEYAFAQCTSLSSINIPNSVTSIGMCAFQYCYSLSTIVIPSSITIIEHGLFGHCRGLTSIEIPSSVKTIGPEAFYECSQLESIVIPSSVTDMGNRTFRDCQNLKSITIPNSVACIGWYEFAGCTNLKSVVIPSSVTSIESSAFMGCEGLVSINIPNTITYISDESFCGCINLLSINIPNFVTSIGNRSFYNCKSLSKVTIPNTVSVIGEEAFAECQNIKKIILGHSLKSIYSKAFASCKELETITCLASYVPSASSDTFKDSYVDYAELIVPEELVQYYKKTLPWSEFGQMSVINTNDYKIWDFTKGVSEATRAALDADGTNWDATKNSELVSTSWVTKANVEGELMAGGNVIPEFAGLNFSQFAATNAVNYLVTKLRLQKNCSFTINGLKAGQKIELKAQPTKRDATDRGFGFENAAIIEGPEDGKVLGRDVEGAPEGGVTTFVLIVQNDGAVKFSTGVNGAPASGVEILSIIINEGDKNIKEWDFSAWSEVTQAQVCNAEDWTTAEANTKNYITGNEIRWINTPTFDANNDLTAGGAVITEMRGLRYEGLTQYGIALAFDYGTTLDANMWGPYVGEKYLRICNRNNKIIVPDVKSGSTLKLGVESHKPGDARGFKLVVNGKEIAAQTTDAYAILEYDIPASNEEYVDVTLVATNGCHLYFIKAEVKKIGIHEENKDIITIDDNCTEFSHSMGQCKEISYTRNFSNTSWQSLYVPFAMSYDDWKDDFDVAYINAVHQYDDDDNGEIDRTEIEVIKMKEGKSIEPNTHYLIKAKTTGEKTITLEDVTLYQTQENTYDVTSWFTRFNFIGTYHTIINMASNGYYAMSDGALKKATSDAVTLQPFRWYLSVTDRNGNPVSLNSKSMSIVFDDGETTGIETFNNKAKESTSIHTLTGISKGNDMKSLAPGIYIKNGKKFIVK